MPVQLHALFHCNAAPAIGAGHVTRCLTLANALAAEEWACTFVCEAGSVASVASLGTTRHRVVELSSVGPADLRAASPSGTTLCVIDNYSWGANQEEALCGWAERILVIDDLADRRHCCDVLLDQSPGRQPSAYDGLLPDHCARIIGGAHALIRPEIAAARPTIEAVPQGCRRVIVSPGATDPDNCVATILNGLSGAGIAADVILSSAAPHLNAVRAMLPTLDYPARLHTDVEDMAALQAGAMLAIGAPGMSALERCVIGLPSLLVVTAHNQMTNARALLEAGAARLLGPAPAVTAHDVASAVAKLDEGELAAMRMAALEVCDGRGVGRVVNALVGPAKDRFGRAVTLRPVVSSDWPLLLRWQRQPEVRRHFHDPSVPNEATHKAWLKRQLRKPRALTNLILVDGEPAGIVRLDSTDERGTMVVSILVAPAEHGAGVGRLALTQAARLAPEARLIADVHRENTASHRLFRSCGFAAETPERYSLPPRQSLAVETTMDTPKT